MSYILPQDVISPKNMINKVNVLYDGGQDGISLAEIDWNGKLELAIRYNSSYVECQDPNKISGKQVCKGVPFSSAHPVWFILPLEIFDPFSSIGKIVSKYSKQHMSNSSQP